MRAAPLLLALALPGCLAMGDLPDAPPTEATQPQAPPAPVGSPPESAVRLAGSLLPRGGGFEARFEAVNEGAFARTQTRCGSPWSFEVRDASGRTVPFEAPVATCRALVLEPFPAGDRREAAVAWDGTVYDGAAPAGRAAPGDYVLVATFQAVRGEAGVFETRSLPFALEG